MKIYSASTPWSDNRFYGRFFNFLPRYSFGYANVDTINGMKSPDFTYGTPSLFTNRYRFDGSSGFGWDIDGENDFRPDGAIECVFSVDNAALGNQSLGGVFTDNSLTDYLYIEYDGTAITLQMDVGGSTNTIFWTHSFSSSTKYHIMLVYNGGASVGSYKLFVNGEDKGNGTASSSNWFWFDDLNGGTPLNISVGYAKYFNGNFLGLDGDIYRYTIWSNLSFMSEELLLPRVSEELLW